jgi:hypothetical protein
MIDLSELGYEALIIELMRSDAIRPPAGGMHRIQSEKRKEKKKNKIKEINLFLSLSFLPISLVS